MKALNQIVDKPPKIGFLLSSDGLVQNCMILSQRFRTKQQHFTSVHTNDTEVFQSMVSISSLEVYLLAELVKQSHEVCSSGHGQSTHACFRNLVISLSIQYKIDSCDKFLHLVEFAKLF